MTKSYTPDYYNTELIKAVERTHCLHVWITLVTIVRIATKKLANGKYWSLFSNKVSDSEKKIFYDFVAWSVVKKLSVGKVSRRRNTWLDHFSSVTCARERCFSITQNTHFVHLYFDPILTSSKLFHKNINGTVCFQNVISCLYTNIYSYLETSGGSSSICI